MTADGNLKANRFSFYRSDTSEPTEKEFFLMHSSESKTIANTATKGWKRVEETVGMDCPVQMRAAREAAKLKVKKFAEKGIVAFFCYHGFPVRQTIVPMVTAEQFSYYVPPLKNIMAVRDVKAFGLDVNCKFESYVKRKKELPVNNTKFVTGKLSEFFLFPGFCHQIFQFPFTTVVIFISCMYAIINKLSSFTNLLFLRRRDAWCWPYTVMPAKVSFCLFRRNRKSDIRAKRAVLGHFQVRCAEISLYVVRGLGGGD